jgi:hypothetical protein
MLLDYCTVIGTSAYAHPSHDALFTRSKHASPSKRCSTASPWVGLRCSLGQFRIRSADPVIIEASQQTAIANMRFI